MNECFAAVVAVAATPVAAAPVAVTPVAAAPVASVVVALAPVAAVAVAAASVASVAVAAAPVATAPVSASPVSASPVTHHYKFQTLARPFDVLISYLLCSFSCPFKASRIISVCRNSKVAQIGIKITPNSPYR